MTPSSNHSRQRLNAADEVGACGRDLMTPHLRTIRRRPHQFVAHERHQDGAGWRPTRAFEAGAARGGWREMDVQRRAIADDRFVHGVVIAALLQTRRAALLRGPSAASSLKHAALAVVRRPDETEPVLQAPYDRTMVIERPHARKLGAY